MLRQYLKAWSKHNSGNRKHRGFTLAELIVVLAIVAILATVGVFAAVGYINRSRIDKNTQDAITVYQVAQTAIAHKADNGTLDNWVSTAFSSSGFSAADFKDDNGRDVLDETNKSIHKTAHLTCDPNKVHADSDTLYDLLSPYFYDRAVFAGTISVEFDLSATKQNDGTIAYSATVMSAFYSRENVAPTGTGGWDSKCLGNSNDQLPQRDQEYRYNTSYVGYFNGTEASLIGPVALPDDLDATPAAEVTFRNGETLDITWTILADHDKTDDVYINLFNSDSLAALTDDSSSNNPASIATILIEGGESAIESKATTTQANDYECIKVNTEGYDHTYNIEKTVKTGVITIKVSTNNGSSYVEHTFPVTVREVFGDGRQEITQYADMSLGYKTYTLSIDCMMVHNDYTSTNNNYTKNYTTKVLFNANKNQPYNPQNICATLVTGTNSDSDYFVATRAIDDPIHYEGLTQGSFRNGTHTAVSYNLEDGNRAALDTEKGCVVNTLFGDLICSDGSVTYNGSFGSSQGGDAVITSFRHLSNIRMTNVGNFHIARDLNWYIKASGSLTPYSEVKVYSLTNGVYNSPIDRKQSSVANSYRVVSFPAIDEIKANQSLSAMHRSDDATQLYSINSVQMRLASFTNNNNNGYGLICKNSGTVSNIVTNNLNLVVYEVADGSASDYSKIEKTSITTGKHVNRPRGTETTAIGGLIGLNTGKVGTTDSDVIRMSNPIVMGSAYWSIEKYFEGTGGVIGKNTETTSSLSGEIEINGTFVVFSHTNIGGIIGRCDQNIGARLIVNGTPAPESEFHLSNDSKYGAVSCVVAGWNSPGGAIGKMENGAFTYRADYEYDGISAPDASGNFSFNNYDQYEYQVDVNLPANSLIVQLTSGDNNETDAKGRLRGAGGAIGNMKNCNSSSSSEGNYLSIRVQNEGSVLSANNINNQNPIYCGGAVGRDEDSKIATTFVRVVNGENTRIGYPSDNLGPYHFTAGGAYGQINGSGRNVAIYVENKGTITARGSTDYLGVGGAVGCTSTGDVPTFVIKAINNSAEITDLNNDGVNMVNGAGGAIGSISNDKEISSDSVIYVENTNTTISGYYFVGGAIGNAPSNNGKISVVNDGATITGVGSTNYVGGAIGRITGNSTGGTIQVVLDSCSIKGGEYVGGVIGLNDSVLSSVSIEGSGNIIGTGNYVGGAIGYNNGEIGGDVDVALSGNVNGGGNYVGGAIGYNNETISGSVDTEFIGNISGFNFVGGAIGQNKAEIGGSVTVLYTGDSSVIGIDYVGGAIGSNDEQITDNVEVSATGDLVIGNENHSGSYVGGVIGDSVGEVGGIAASFDGEVSIYGVDYVGGAVGNLSGDLTIDKSISIVFAEASEIHGRINVGGVIGKNDVELASVSARFNGPGTVIGSSDVGGSIGYNNNDISGTVSAIFEGQAIIGNASNPGDNVGGVIGNSVGEVGGISVAFGDDAYIYGYDNVGGAAGNLVGEITTSKVIDVVFTADTVIRGNNNVGGAIGNNEVALTSVTATFKGDAQVIGSENVGGAIGNTEADISGAIAASFKGEAIVGNKNKTGNYVGGVIGNCKNKAGSLSADFADDAFIYGANYVGGVVGNLVGTLTTNTISVVFNGDCEIYGANNVGGAIGYNEVALTSVTATFKHDGKIIGSSYVGGAIGNNQTKISGTVSASFGGSAIIGDSTNKGNYVGGVIGNSVGEVGGITVAFGKDTSIYGKDYVGGAVGNLLGNLTSNKSISVYVPGNLTIKAANNVGGAIGYSFVTGLKDVTVKVDGITDIECSGGNVGGAIGYHWNNNSDNSNKIEGIISANFGKAVTVSGNGDYVGGVIGNSYSNIKGIAVTYGSSANISGKNYVGGMAGYLKGGLDNKTIAMTVPGDFTINGVDYVGGAFGYNTASLNGITVKYNGTASITGKKYIGGAMGYNNKFNSSNPVSVLYSKTAEIIGSECVGGAIGQSVGKTGMLSADFKGRATIGDNSNKGNYIGGVIGNSMAEISGIKVTFADDVNIYGADYVGGAVGNLQGKVNTDKSISVSVPGNLTINAADKVGGAIGYSKVELKDVSVSVAGKTEITSTAGNVGGAIGLHDTAKINGTISASFGDTVKISGVSDYVGGVIGNSNFDIGGVQVSYDSTVDISGKNYVGGMVGNLRGGVTNNNIVMTVTDDFSLSGENYVGGAFGDSKATLTTVNVIYNKAATISGKEAVGGIIGFNEKVNTGNRVSLSVQYNGTADINGSDGVGGVVGKNIGTVKSVTVTYKDDVSINGNEGVGGVIGINNKNNNNNATVSETVTVSYEKSGSIIGKNNTGGVIGYNNMTISGTVSADFNGMATIGNSSNAGECVGGVIGNNIGSVVGITVAFRDDADICGTDYVGGVIGNNGAAISGDITVTYEKSGSLIGSNDVGGAIGYNNKKISGTVSADFKGMATIGDSNNTGNYVGGVIGNSSGEITSDITAAFRDDVSICGSDYVGGVIGNNGAAISGTVNVSYENSGLIDGADYVGGVIGYNNKNLYGISVDLSDVSIFGNDSVGGAFGSYAGGTITNGITVEATNLEIVGNEMVGGAFGSYAGGTITNGITVEATNLEIVGNEMVGGAIGSVSGGNINGRTIDYTDVEIRTITGKEDGGSLSIDLTNAEITGNKKVGGAIGSVSGGAIYNGIVESLDHSYVGGIEEVGGVIGEIRKTYQGGMIVSFNNGTYIGDKKGAGSYRCVDAGGAFGYFSNSASISSGRVLIKFDETSMVYAGGTDYSNSDLTIDTAGVGGAFGRLGAEGQGNTPTIELTKETNTYLASVEVYCKSYEATVYSARSIAGGFVGHMLSGTIKRGYATAVVSGYDYVGGFVGKMDNGYIGNCYVGGHTYKGQYDSGEENITGENYVGGFAGYISEAVAGSKKIYQTYTTASVRGSSNVGGYAGYIGGADQKLYSCYCTGLVSLKPGGDPDTVGAFAGSIDNIAVFFAEADNLENGNKVLRYVNASDMRRIGNIGGVPTDDGDLAAVPKTRIRWAFWGGYEMGPNRNDYIRVRPKEVSKYDAFPFDETLDPTDEKYPLRTFISQKFSDDTFYGLHYGDWPSVMTETTKLLNDSNTRIIFVDDNGDELLDEHNNPITEFPYAIGDVGVSPKVKVFFTDEYGEQDITGSQFITISYKNNITVGEASVIVTGDGANYGHSVVKKFTIVPLDISDATVTIDTTAAGFIYNGQPQEPAVKVILSSGEELPAGDYQVAYSDNTNAGTATVTVTPDNTKYVVNNTSGTPGTLSAEFIIDKKKIEAADMNVTCSGEVDAPIITVSVTIEGNATTLDASDYSAVLSDSKDKLTVTIDAANFYSDPVEYTVHTVTFMMNDESGDVYKTLIVMDNGTVSAPADPSRENYAFQGWITDPNDPDSAFAWDTQINDNVVLYASWTANRGAVPSTDESNGEENGEGTDADTDSKDEGNLGEDNGSKKGVENDDATNTRSTVDPTESGTGGSSGETVDVDDDETISGSPDETPGEGSDESAGGDDDESTGEAPGGDDGSTSEVPGGDDGSTGEVPGGDFDESAGESAGGTEDNTFDEATDETAGDTTNGATDGDSNSDTDVNAGGGSEGEIGGGTGGDSGGGNNTDPGSDPGGAPQDPVPGNNENPTP